MSLALTQLEKGGLFLDFESFVDPELYILIPILYIVGRVIKKSSIKDSRIPLLLGITGIVLCTVYLLTKSIPHSTKEIFALIFSGVTQGALCAASSVYVHNLIKQSKESDEDTEDSEESAEQIRK